MQVRSVFLHWLPWLLRMNRPKRKITRKTIAMSIRMKELEMKEKTSKSLIANVLDLDDDFRYIREGERTLWRRGKDRGPYGGGGRKGDLMAEGEGKGSSWRRGKERGPYGGGGRKWDLMGGGGGGFLYYSYYHKQSKI
jgi:hypothetical protein